MAFLVVLITEDKVPPDRSFQRKTPDHALNYVAGQDTAQGYFIVEQREDRALIAGR